MAVGPVGGLLDERQRRMGRHPFFIADALSMKGARRLSHRE